MSHDDRFNPLDDFWAYVKDNFAVDKKSMNGVESLALAVYALKEMVTTQRLHDANAPPWMKGDPRLCKLCGHDGDWHAQGNNNISQCRGYSPPETDAADCPRVGDTIRSAAQASALPVESLASFGGVKGLSPKRVYVKERTNEWRNPEGLNGDLGMIGATVMHIGPPAWRQQAEKTAPAQPDVCGPPWYPCKGCGTYLYKCSDEAKAKGWCGTCREHVSFYEEIAALRTRNTQLKDQLHAAVVERNNLHSECVGLKMELQKATAPPTPTPARTCEPPDYPCKGCGVFLKDGDDETKTYGYCGGCQDLVRFYAEIAALKAQLETVGVDRHNWATRARQLQEERDGLLMELQKAKGEASKVLWPTVTVLKVHLDRLEGLTTPQPIETVPLEPVLVGYPHVNFSTGRRVDKWETMCPAPTQSLESWRAMLKADGYFMWLPNPKLPGGRVPKEQP